MAIDTQKPDDSQQISKGMRFVLGGAAGMTAALFVHPADLLKNRMQLNVEESTVSRRSTFQTLKSVIRNEGPLALYSGLSASMLRQISYTTVRLGVYSNVFQLLSSPDKPPNFATKLVMGMTAGGIGAFIATPSEVALIRMTGDGRLPPDQRRGYKNAIEALIRITKEEGILTLWRGSSPTVIRAMIVNAIQLGIYSETKQKLLSTKYFEDNIWCHFASSMVSGFVTSVATLPVDIAKTRVQNMKVINGKPEYKGAFDVIVKVAKNEGVSALWKGFTPYYLRCGPHTLLMLVFFEQFTHAYEKYVLKLSKGSRTM